MNEPNEIAMGASSAPTPPLADGLYWRQREATDHWEPVVVVGGDMFFLERNQYKIHPTRHTRAVMGPLRKPKT